MDEMELDNQPEDYSNEDMELMEQELWEAEIADREKFTTLQNLVTSY